MSATRNASKPTPKHKNPPPQAVKDAEWGGFIDVRLDDDLKEKFKLWMTQNSDNLWLLFAETLGRGMKFSLSFDAENDCFISTLTAVVTSLSGRRYALTARASTWEEAIYLMLFKHYFVLAEDWGNFRPRQPYNQSWG